MCLGSARLGLPVGGRLLIEVQVELLGRWALLRHEVGPPDGYSGVPAMSRAAPARPLRLVFSPLSLVISILCRRSFFWSLHQGSSSVTSANSNPSESAWMR